MSQRNSKRKKNLAINVARYIFIRINRILQHYLVSTSIPYLCSYVIAYQGHTGMLTENFIRGTININTLFLFRILTIFFKDTKELKVLADARQQSPEYPSDGIIKGHI